MRKALLLVTAGVAMALSGARRGGAQTTEDYRFTPPLKRGDLLDLRNIDGSMTITQGGSSAAIVVHKVVRRGDGSLVKAIMEKTADGYRVCAIYLHRGESRDTCNGEDHDGGNDEPLDVDLNFDVQAPAGVRLAVHSVDGSVDARGVDAATTIRTVDGNITYRGVAPTSLNTVDGSIDATVTDATWDHDVALRSVDGGIDVTLPPSINVTLTGETVDGDFNSDFPVTLAGKWGPRSMHATIGSGGSRELRMSTIDGSIRLHRGS